MASITPSTSDIFTIALDGMLLDFRVALPGIIKTYDNAAQTAEVQLMVKRVVEDTNGDLTEESFPVLPDVPVIFPRGGTFGITFPLAAGDNVLVLFCDMSIDQWRAKNRESAPDDLRLHDTNGAVCIPGLYATGQEFQSAHATHMVMGKDDGVKMYFKTDGVIHAGEENAQEFVAMAQKVFNELSALRTAVVTAFAILNANASVAFPAHTHISGIVGLPTGPAIGAMATVVDPPAVNSVAATKMKVT